MSSQRTHTYLLWHPSAADPSEPTPFYVGESVNPEARFKQHVRDSADPSSTKEAYAYLREHNIGEFFYEVVPNTTEAALVADLTLSGYRLYNGNSGIKKASKKKRDDSFAVLNRQAHERLEAIERRNRLHGQQQNLSRSAIVQQRISGDVPSLDALRDATWYECPPELLGVDVARTAERAERCQLGDINVYIAWRNKDREQSMLARNTRTGKEVRQEQPMYWQLKDRETVLKTLARIMAIDFYWEKPYQ